MRDTFKTELHGLTSLVLPSRSSLISRIVRLAMCQSSGMAQAICPNGDLARLRHRCHSLGDPLHDGCYKQDDGDEAGASGENRSWTGP
jgi:hypothetical protein